MDDKIWRVGGRMEVDINDPEELKSDKIEEYDPKEDTWSTVGRLMRKLDSRCPIRTYNSSCILPREMKNTSLII